jgi:hypothetical protein
MYSTVRYGTGTAVLHVYVGFLLFIVLFSVSCMTRNCNDTRKGTSGLCYYYVLVCNEMILNKTRRGEGLPSSSRSENHSRRRHSAGTGAPAGASYTHVNEAPAARARTRMHACVTRACVALRSTCTAVASVPAMTQRISRERESAFRST